MTNLRNGSQKCVILDAAAARRSGPAFFQISLRKKLIFWSKDLVRYTLGHASQSDYIKLSHLVDIALHDISLIVILLGML